MVSGLQCFHIHMLKISWVVEVSLINNSVTTVQKGGAEVGPRGTEGAKFSSHLDKHLRIL